MPNLLRDLPPKILSHILTYDDTTGLSLQLWLLCNKGLHRSLADAVTFVELRNTERWSLCKLPKYLTQLLSLRHLIIDRAGENDYERVYDLSRSLEVLQHLPEGLETLILRFRSSKLLLFPLDPSSEPHLSLISTYPNLVRLHLDKETAWTPQDAKLLPQSITDLGIVAAVPRNDLTASIMPLIESLPPMLESLKLFYQGYETIGSATFFSKLPPHLRTLVISSPALSFESSDRYSYDTIAALPRSMTSINVTASSTYSNEWHMRGTRAIAAAPDRSPLGSFTVQFTPEFIAVTPPYLLQLSVTTKDKHMKVLPPLSDQLQELEIATARLKSQHLRSLPRGLLRLGCSLDRTKKLVEGDFPPTLRQLQLHGKNGLDSHLLSLLPPLTRLGSRISIDMSLISQLPPTLLHLNILLRNADESVRFPPNLLTLDVSAPSDFTILAPNKSKSKSVKKIKSQSILRRLPPPPDSVVLKTFPFHALPTSLRELRLVGFWVPLSRIGDAPPLLRSLDLWKLFIDADYSPTSRRMLQQAQRLRDEAGEVDVCELRTPDAQAESISMFDLLPRKLTRFLLSAADLPQHDPIEFRRMPPNLTELFLCGRAPMDPDFLLHLPNTKLTSLTAGFGPLKDLHVEAMPRRLRTLSLTCSPRLDISMDCLKLLPFPEESFHANWEIEDPTLRAACWQLLVDLNQALDDDSGITLESLLKERRAPWLHR